LMYTRSMQQSKGYDTVVSCGSEDIVSVYGSICIWI